MPPFERSWEDLKRPSYLRRELISTENWLQGKRVDDDLEGFWRIHDKLYDLEEFMGKHPGGEQWLEITKGTDCTELFESHHLHGKAEAILPKYYVKVATTPRNAPYTFNDDGFYRTLKKEVRETLATLPVKLLKLKSKLIMDSIVFLTLSLVVTAAALNSYTMAALAGVFLAFTAISSHNFFHQKDNWRMYYFNLSALSIRDLRISHIMGHHAFPNTLLDIEFTSFEPLFNFVPDPEKRWTVRYLSWLYLPLVYATVFHVELIHRLIYKSFTKSDVIGLLIPTLLYLANGRHFFSAFFMMNWLVLFASLVFNLHDIVASHRHPDSFQEGDAPRDDRDWGLFQIDTTKDNCHLTGNSLFVMIMFGDHTLHHLFPTLDHSVLRYLYPTFLKTCKKFNVEFKTESWFELVTGEFRSLARNKPKKIPPQ